MAKIKRSQFTTYMNITPESPAITESETATYALIGDGVSKAEIAMNAKTTEEQYIAEDSGSTSLDSYAPNMPVEMTAKLGDAVFGFIDQLRIDRAIAGEAETTIVNVWQYETGTPPSYPAEEQKVAISFEDFGGDAGAGIKEKYTINFVGAPVVGTFVITAGAEAFTAT
jgi:hypothetical protein